MQNNNFLEEMRFFFPSAGLTRSLFAAVEAVRLKDQIRVREDREQVEDVDDDYLKNLPPEEVSEVASAASPASGRVSEQEEALLQQRFIAEELYHHLAFLARSPQAREGRSLPVRDAVANGMRSVLGLPQQEALLTELADEFASWLNEVGQFTTGWGNITLAEGNRLYLEELLPREGGAAIPSRRVFIPHVPSSRKRVRRQRKAGVAGSSG